MLIAGFLMNVNYLIAQEVSSFSPNEIIGGKGDVLTITGSGFGNDRGSNYVSFFGEDGNYSDATSGNRFKFLSWSNSEIKLEMPVAFSNKVKVMIGGAELTSGSVLKVMANISYRNVNPLTYNLLVDRNNLGGVTWFVHPTFWDNDEIRQAIADVVQEFRCKTGVNYVIERLHQEVPLSLDQGVHIITPDQNLEIVGYNARQWSSCILGAETFYYNETQLLQFGTDQKWYYGKGQAPDGFTKFRYVLFHEMGHSLGLGHVNEEGQSMYPTVNFLPSDNWSARDSITTAEKTAIQHFVSLSQDFSFRACGINPLTTITDCENVYGSSAHIAEGRNRTNSLIFPNPVSRNFTIKLPKTVDLSDAKILIFDYRGVLVAEEIINTTESIKTPNSLVNGIYIANLFTNNQVFTSRFVVQKD